MSEKRRNSKQSSLPAQSEDVARLVLDGIDVGVYMKGRDRRYLYINRSSAEALHRTPDDVIGRTDVEMLPPEVERNIRRVDDSVFETGQPQYAEETLSEPDGSLRYFWSTKQLVKGPQDRDCLLGYSAEITSVKKAAEAIALVSEELRASEAKFRQAFASANTGMCIVDLQGKFLEVNGKMIEIFGYGKRELEGMTVNDLTVPEDAGVSPEFIEQAVKGEVESAIFEKRYRHKDGHLIYGVVSSSLVRDAQGAPLFFISQVQDETRRKQAEDALALANADLARLASTDPLTGTWNRRQFELIVTKLIAQALRYGEPLCLLMFDIDHFKAINDSHGHDVGDLVLVELVDLVKADLRAGDELARWGGEEFLIILPHSTAEDGQKVAEKLRILTEQHDFKHVGKLTVSFGVASWQSNESIKEWYARVDHAMYAAKAAGRNMVKLGEWTPSGG